MAQSFAETAHLKTNKEEFDKNFDSIFGKTEVKRGTYVFRYGQLIEIDEKEAIKFRKHSTAGMCGEYGMSEQGSRGGFGEGVIHKDPELFTCPHCNYDKNRNADFCENCITKL